MMNKKQLGASGETIAAAYLVQRGYRILQKNYRLRNGEIDLIAKDGQTYVFVEVKTRSSRVFGLPEEAITPQKMQFLIRSAAHYAAQQKISQQPMRIDAVLIETAGQNLPPRIRHIKNISF